MQTAAWVPDNKEWTKVAAQHLQCFPDPLVVGFYLITLIFLKFLIFNLAPMCIQMNLHISNFWLVTTMKIRGMLQDKRIRSRINNTE